MPTLMAKRQEKKQETIDHGTMKPCTRIHAEEEEEKGRKRKKKTLESEVNRKEDKNTSRPSLTSIQTLRPPMLITVI